MAKIECKFKGRGCCRETHDQAVTKENKPKAFVINGRRVTVNQAYISGETDLLPSNIWKTPLAPSSELINVYATNASTQDSQGYLPLVQLINGKVIATPTRADCPNRE